VGHTTLVPHNVLDNTTSGD